MSGNIPHAPQGNMPAIGIPDSQDIPRLVFSAPYFEQVPLAELIEPAVIEAVEAALPSLVPPYVDAAAQAAVQAQAVLLVGSTMTGPLFLSPLMPTQPAQAATMAYVDSMVATAGIPEVPPVPSGQVWARETGQWVPITPQTGVFLPLSGGSMVGNINMSGNTIQNMAAVPAMPNGAAPAQWVLNQIASVSLFQGQWDADTNVPDLTQLSVRVNGYTWIAITTSPSGVVVGPAIPGLQGKTVFNGDTIYYSTVDGAFFSIHAGGLTLPEAQSLFVLLAGSQMSGALLLNANASQPLQAVTLQQLEAFVPPGAVPEAPNDGQLYGRNGLTASWAPVLPLAGGILTGALTLSGNATANLNPVPLQQMTSAISAATAGYLPLAGAAMTGLMTLSGNASVGLNPVPLQQLNGMLGTYAPLQNPAFTGVPTVPLAAPGTSTGQIASTAFTAAAVAAAVSGYLPLSGGTLSGGLTINSNLSVADNMTISAGALSVGGIASGPQGTYAISATGPIRTSTGNIILYSSAASNIYVSSFLAGVGGFGFATGSAATLDFSTTNLDGLPTGRIAYFDAIGNMHISGTLTQGSDARTKSNIAAFAPGTSVVTQLLPKTFTYTADAANTGHLGFVAQDVQPVLPEAVSGSEADGFGLDATAIIAVLVNAAKQLISRVEALEIASNITPPAAETA